MAKVFINESDLKNMVCEAVRRIMNEIDWKTYANARAKALERGESLRANKFGSAAWKGFNDEFGLNHGTSELPRVHGDTYTQSVEGESAPNGFESPSHTVVGMQDKETGEEYNYDRTKAFFNHDPRDHENRYARVKNPSLRRFFNNDKQAIDAYNRANKEMSDYRNGRYQYDNGWKLKQQ